MLRYFIKVGARDKLLQKAKEGGGFQTVEVMVTNDFELMVPEPERPYWVELYPSWDTQTLKINALEGGILMGLIMQAEDRPRLALDDIWKQLVALKKRAEEEAGVTKEILPGGMIMGYSLPVVYSERWYDDETGYISSHYLAKKYNPPQKCERCGKPAAWNASGDVPHSYLCLQCADEWHEFAPTVAGFHEGRMTKQKWFDAFNSFLATKPKKIDTEEHNRKVLQNSQEIRMAMKLVYPELYKKYMGRKALDN